MHSPLVNLPAELIQHIFSYLDLHDLVRAAKTCRRLRDQGYDDQSWKSIVNCAIHKPLASAAPFTFRDLFLAHYPHWFLTKHRIWFGDTEPGGKLIVARFNEADRSIEALTVVAVRGQHTLSIWEKNPEVIIHSFNPIISLEPTRPVLRITADGQRTGEAGNNPPAGRPRAMETSYSKEILMDLPNEAGLFSSFMLCRSLPAAAISHGTYVWPPMRFPAHSRTRNDTLDGFHSVGHRPTKHIEVNHHNFRIRKWVEYHGRHATPNSFVDPHSRLAAALRVDMPLFAAASSHGVGGMTFRIPDDISTYATLPEYCYRPTAQKPWQGIWCGDYSGHGCEFLLITQPDKRDEAPLPDGMDWPRYWQQTGRQRVGSDASSASFVSAVEEMEGEAGPREATTFEPTGRIEAIKLTGDPNIPRGEYTFIAPDISDAGLVRVADEATFRGARIVKSAGHIAGRGFRQDRYTRSQLIMISHDKLAQYWEGFGHISYFHRVDVDSLIDS